MRTINPRYRNTPNMLAAISLAAGSLIVFLPAALYGQSRATAHRQLQLSGFALANGTYTGLGGSVYAANGQLQTPGLGGRNISVTLGGDLGVYDFRGLTLSAEVRGTYPLYDGHVDGHKALLGGIRLERPFQSEALRRLRPYVDALAGRGQIDYVDGGYRTAQFLYSSSTTAVYGAGGGFEVQVTPHWAFQADAQVQHWTTPTTATHVIYSKQGGFGVVYRFGAGEAPR